MRNAHAVAFPGITAHKTGDNDKKLDSSFLSRGIAEYHPPPPLSQAPAPSSIIIPCSSHLKASP